MDQLLELFHLDNDDGIFDVEIHTLQAWLVVTISSNFIKYILCCFIKTEDKMLVLQVECHAFLYLSQPRAMLNWLMETRYIPK